MKVAIRYYSRGGHVEAMAEALSRGTGVEAISIDEPGAEITEHVDLLFIGGALYNFQLDPLFKEYLSEIPGDLIDEVVCFGSSWLTRRPIYLMQDYFKAKGIKINKQAIYSRNRPNDDLLGVIEYFAKNEMTRDRSLDGLPPYMIFKRSQELKAEREAAAAEGREVAEDMEHKAKLAQLAAEDAQAEAEAAQAAALEAQEAARIAAEEAAAAALRAAEKAREAAAELAAAKARETAAVVAEVVAKEEQEDVEEASEEASDDE